MSAKDIGYGCDDWLFVLADAKLFKERHVNVDHFVDAGKYPVNHLLRQVEVLVHSLHENLRGVRKQKLLVKLTRLISKC